MLLRQSQEAEGGVSLQHGIGLIQLKLISKSKVRNFHSLTVILSHTPTHTFGCTVTGKGLTLSYKHMHVHITL